ncbi:MAG: helix-turn-helix domain-containing protein [Bacteroidales bacterium]|nr:helix-turn-helix domain-containing protein [Bacteroidales bacterium]
MNRQLTPRQLGKKLKSIRVESGFSQEDIARMLQISRSSVVQIEKGNRQISAIELSMLSEALGFSADEFLSAEYETSTTMAVVEEPELETEMDVMRDSVPKLKRAKLETVILYITGKCGALPRMDVNLLINLLYLCDFNHYELHEEQLTGLLYTKQAFGPSPENISGILKEMEKAGKLQRFKSSYKGIPLIKYLPSIHANLMKLDAAEKEVIDRVLEQFSHWPANALNAYTREEMPLRATKQGEEISYELTFYRRSPHSVRIYDDDWYES